MANETGDVYVLSQLEIEDINDILQRISDRFDRLEGLRGEVTIRDKIKTATGVKVTDVNGTVIHGFGDTTD